jgi:hypothetical protein
MRRIPPLAWFIYGLLSLIALGITFFVGAFASGKDINETCAKARQPLDDVYRDAHWLEPGQIFPMHDKCNANYDMVPFWVNPALVVFVVAVAVCLIGFVVSITTRLVRKFAR